MKKLGNGDTRRSGVRPALEKVLYVEDDDFNWHVAELRLRDRYQLTRAATSEEACREFTQGGRELSAILMDIELQGSELNGIELAELLRGTLRAERLPAYAKSVPVLDTPILFVTAHGPEYGDERLRRAGALQVLSKPVDFAALTLALTQAHLARVGGRRA